MGERARDVVREARELKKKLKQGIGDYCFAVSGMRLRPPIPYPGLGFGNVGTATGQFSLLGEQ
jgi:hypothetical protein